MSTPLAGRYSLWLGGSFRGRLEVRVDGKLVHAARHELNYSPGQYVPLGEALLGRGRHRLELDYDHGDVHPGSHGPEIAPFGAAISRPFALGPLVLRDAEVGDRRTEAVVPSQARRLCRGRLDWIDALG